MSSQLEMEMSDMELPKSEQCPDCGHILKKFQEHFRCTNLDCGNIEIFMPMGKCICGREMKPTIGPEGFQEGWICEWCGYHDA